MAVVRGPRTWIPMSAASRSLQSVPTLHALVLASQTMNILEKVANDPRAYEPGGFTAESPDPNIDFSRVRTCYVRLSKYLRFTAAGRPGPLPVSLHVQTNQ